jgi:hypothetical protein
MRDKRSLALVVLMILSLEKSIQHMFVTYAFIVNLGEIRESVTLNYQFFMVSGFFVGILFLASLFLLIRRDPRGLKLLLYLALFDFFGEFIAQGRLFITVTVSFMVASLIILVIWRKQDELLYSDADEAMSPAG